MSIIYRDIVQGTSEWIAIRCGVPTSSQFHRIITPGGKPSKSAETYLFELLAERLTGEPTAEHMSYWMSRGSELEADAVNFYHLQCDCDTEKIGFILSDDGRVGCSPDRLVGEHGLLEIKCCKPSTHIGYLLGSGVAYEEHATQVQGQLWIAEREWNDLLAYNPLLPPALTRVERDDAMIAAIAKEVTKFSNALEEKYLELVARGWARTPQERTVSDLEASIEILKKALVSK